MPPDIQLPARKRPVFVTILFVLFCIGVPVWLINIVGIFMATARPGGQHDFDRGGVLASHCDSARSRDGAFFFNERRMPGLPLAVAVVIDLPVRAMFLLQCARGWKGYHRRFDFDFGGMADRGGDHRVCLSAVSLPPRRAEVSKE